MIIDKEGIKKHLPHREPFLFVDSVKAFEEGKFIEAEFFMDASLEFFKGHFPENPIMPGVLILEALAQTSGLVVSLSKKNSDSRESAPKIFYLASNNLKFLSPARAGETLVLISNLLKTFDGLFQFSVEARCGREKVAAGTLVLADPKK